MRRKGKILLWSVAVWSAGQALMGVFISAFILRATGNDISKVLLFQAVQLGALPFASLANLLLVGRARTVALYSVASLAQIGVYIILTCGIPMTFATLVGAGIAYGLAAGFLWPNRNMAVLEATNDSERNLYCGFELFFGTGFGVIMPIVAGWFIASAVVSVPWAYRILSWIAFALVSVASAILLVSDGWERPPRVRLRGFRLWKTRSWKWLVPLSVFKGGTILFGSVLSPLLVIVVFGRGEGMLGIVQGACGILGALIALVCGRFASPRSRAWMFTAGAVVCAMAAFMNLAFTSAVTVIAILATWPFAYQTTELSFYAMEMKVFDDCEKDQPGSTPIFLCAFEFLAAAGRLMTAGAFFAALKCLGQTAALYFSLGVLAFALLASVPIVFSLERHN